MQKNMLSKALIATLMGSSLLLVACNDDNDDKKSANNGEQQVQQDTITGIAATGAALAGADVEVINKAGKSAKAVAGTDGKFSLKIDVGAPYMIKASKGDKVLYSYTATAGYVNVTQLTTQAVLEAYEKGNIATLYKDWAVLSNKITQAKIDEAAKKVAANLDKTLSAKLTAEKVDAKKLNIFTQQFEANSKGLDAILDDIQVLYNCNLTSCNVEYKVKGETYTGWNYNISTDGYTWVINNPGGPAGSGQNCLIDMDYNYSISVPGYGNQTGKAVYKICYENFPQNAACAAGNQNLKNLVNTAAGNAQGVGYSITVNKYDIQSVASCPTGVIKAVYQ